MIEFNCPHCEKLFRVPDELAGRAAKCKACGGALTVPAESTERALAMATGPKPIPRTDLLLPPAPAGPSAPANPRTSEPPNR